MRSGITAVVLSAQPVRRKLPGLEVVNYVSQFRDAAGLLDARINSIGHVKTSHFFWLDDDDELPEDYLDVLSECLATKAPLAYTRELCVMGNQSWVSPNGPYCAERHAQQPMFVHHLALCRTSCAAEAWRCLPRGCYAPEPLLYYELARQGSAFVDRVGYIWHRKPGGLSTTPDVVCSQARAAIYNVKRWRDKR